MKDYVNWAILAPGTIAASMAQAMKGTAQKDSRIRLYAVGSRNQEKAEIFAKKWGFSKAYGSYEALLSDPDVDAVYIANPHAFHFESVMQCLEKGKHVLCEKPAGCNLNQLENMIKTAREKKLFFMEAMWTAFNPCVNRIFQAVKEGKIGELKHIESRFCNRIPYDEKSRLWAPELAGGALLDLGIYNIYYSLMMNSFNPVKKTNSIVKTYKNVDCFEEVNLIFDNGVTAGFQSACDRPAGSNTHDAWIFGTKGFIFARNFFLCQEAEIHTYTSDWGNDNVVSEVIKAPFDINGYEYELIHSTECILSGKTESDIHTSERSVELCKIMDSLRSDWNFKYPFEK